MNYRERLALSGSRVKLLQCPAKYKYELDNPKEPTDAMRFGTLVHTAVLEPAKLVDYAVMPDGMIRRGKAYDEWCAENAGKEEVKADKYLQAHTMSEVLRANPLCKRILDDSKVEQEYYWEEDGVQCKGRIDFVRDDLYVIGDYKTTNDASLEGFYWTVKDMGYLLQIAHYQAGYAHACGRAEMPGALIIAQETEAPYLSVVYEIPQGLIDEAHAKRKELLQVYRTCLETGIWGGYSDEIVRLERR